MGLKTQVFCQYYSIVCFGLPYDQAFSPDPDDDLVEVSKAIGPRSRPTNVGGVGLPELVDRAAKGLVSNVGPTLGEHLLDVAERGGEAYVEPHHQADCVGGKAVAVEGYRIRSTYLNASTPPNGDKPVFA